MSAREAAIAAVLGNHEWLRLTDAGDGRCACGWATPGNHPSHVAAAIVAALDTPAAPVTEAGTYPCCGQCDAGCSGRHEIPCPLCQFDTTAAVLAVADEGAARARGELA